MLIPHFFSLRLSYNMLGKKASWLKKMIPGKRTAAIAGTLLLAGLGKMAADRGARERVEHARAQQQSGARPSSSAPRPPPPAPKADPCSAVMCPKGIRTRKDYLRWSARGGHPDKGGSTAAFQSVNNCQSEGKFCKRWVRWVSNWSFGFSDFLEKDVDSLWELRPRNH